MFWGFDFSQTTADGCFLSIICQIYYKHVAGFAVMRHKKSVYFIMVSFVSEKTSIYVLKYKKKHVYSGNTHLQGQG